MANTSSSKAPKPNGRPSFNPTAEHRRQVEFMSSFKIPQYQIAKSLQIAPHTLRKHFRAQFVPPVMNVNTYIPLSLYTLATRYRNTTAAIFWAKTRARFHSAAPSQAALPSANPSPTGLAAPTAQNPVPGCGEPRGFLPRDPPLVYSRAKSCPSIALKHPKPGKTPEFPSLPTVRSPNLIR